MKIGQKFWILYFWLIFEGVWFLFTQTLGQCVELNSLGLNYPPTPITTFYSYIAWNARSRPIEGLGLLNQRLFPGAKLERLLCRQHCFRSQGDEVLFDPQMSRQFQLLIWWSKNYWTYRKFKIYFEAKFTIENWQKKAKTSPKPKMWVLYPDSFQMEDSSCITQCAPGDFNLDQKFGRKNLFSCLLWCKTS